MYGEYRQITRSNKVATLRDNVATLRKDVIRAASIARNPLAVSCRRFFSAKEEAVTPSSCGVLMVKGLLW